MRDGRVHQAEYHVRMFGFTELRDWLLDAGFSSVDGRAGDGGPLTAESRRMIVIATRVSYSTIAP